ncbi:hypothetical protein L6164_029876 [Bauhinia variegata]|uniref:Uncharacterized protein n=1 Tax=Bauhinia variegata TaxID=167791 RepID=A0ACB9LAR9_BAUVA|nr:hypothetical protein L6164_029876 [Bauhinia variegata]
MFSLKFPLSIQSAVTPPKPTIPSYNSSRFQTPRFNSFSTLKLRSVSPSPAIAANVAVGGEVQGDPNDGSATAPKFEPVPPGLQLELMPNHVAVILDGNRRWAKQRGLPTSAGHGAGGQALIRLIDICRSWGIKVLTVFGFSTDNWVRPKAEVDFLMNLFERTINSQIETAMREDIRISAIGDVTKLPTSLQRAIRNAEEVTKDNSKFHLIFAVNYGGKYDVVQACKSVAEKVKDGLIQLEDINENLIEQELETNCTEFPHPDLLIRTSGELRVSNFLLWQLAYTELYFNPVLWPDFGKDEFVEALTSFQKRKRRYGGRN